MSTEPMPQTELVEDAEEVLDDTNTTDRSTMNSNTNTEMMGEHLATISMGPRRLHLRTDVSESRGGRGGRRPILLMYAEWIRRDAAPGETTIRFTGSLHAHQARDLVRVLSDGIKALDAAEATSAEKVEPR